MQQHFRNDLKDFSWSIQKRPATKDGSRFARILNRFFLAVEDRRQYERLSARWFHRTDKRTLIHNRYVSRRRYRTGSSCSFAFLLQPFEDKILIREQIPEVERIKTLTIMLLLDVFDIRPSELHSVVNVLSCILWRAKIFLVVSHRPSLTTFRAAQLFAQE